MNFRNWNGKALVGEWLFTLKIDGIQAHIESAKDGDFTQNDDTFNVVTKGGNKIYNLPSFLPNFQVAEIFCGSWNNTMSIARASKSKRRQILRKEIYPLFPTVDPRLVIGVFTNPEARFIKLAFDQAQMDEYEGLVLRQLGTTNYIKVKASYSEDVRIIGYLEGNGRLKGSLGKFITEGGQGVGTGFTDEQRREFWRKRVAFVKNGVMIEVEGMEKTSDGKIRHPRFVRLRLDK